MIRRLASSLVLVGLLFVGVAGVPKGKIKRLEADEKDHYYALRVFMDEDTQKTWLKLKTRDERDQWLKDNSPITVGQQTSYWDMYYQYSDKQRDKIALGDVAVGWSEDRVLMAWGRPHETRRVTKRDASRSEIWMYRFEVTPKGEVMVWVSGSNTTYKAVDRYQYDVHIDDKMVTELVKKDQWQ